MAAASTNSWLRPPRPLPRSVTVVSPPVMMQARRLQRPARPRRSPCAMAACMRATSRVSPSMNVESTSVRKPSSRARFAAASTASRLLPITRLSRAPEDRVAGLGRFRDLAAPRRAPGAPARGAGTLPADAVLVQNLQRAREGGGVRRGGAGADHVEVVADHVGEQQRYHRRGTRQPRQLPALDARDVLAHGVDLVDVRAAGEQQARGLLLLRERDGLGGQRQQRRGAAGDQADHQVVRPRPLRDGGDAPRALPRRARPAPGGRIRSARCAAASPGGRTSR